MSGVLSTNVQVSMSKQAISSNVQYVVNPMTKNYIIMFRVLEIGISLVIGHWDLGFLLLALLIIAAKMRFNSWASCHNGLASDFNSGIV